MEPPSLALCREAGQCQTFWTTHALDAYGLRAPEPLEVKAHDGTTLYATLLLPVGAKDAASVPLIVNPYGGPGPQEVADRWSDALLFDELLVEHGFAVLHADNRGTGMRGETLRRRRFRTSARYSWKISSQLSMPRLKNIRSSIRSGSAGGGGAGVGRSRFTR